MVNSQYGVTARFFLGFLSWLVISTMAVSAWCMDFTAHITQDAFNNHFTGKIDVSNDRYRLVLHPPGVAQDERLTVIVNRRTGKTILLPPKSQTYEEVENFTFRAYMVDPFQSISNLEKIAQKKKIGTETVSGYACEHYAFYDQDFKLADVWFATDLDSFPVKAHMVSGRDDGNIKVKTNIGDSKIELSNIKKESVDAGLFDLPQGVTKTHPRPKEEQEQVALTDTQKGSSPWGRRIGKGGEIQVKTDPQRPVKISLKNLADESVCTCTAIPRGNAIEEGTPTQVTLTKKGQRRKIEIDKNKKTERVFIRVKEGMIFTKVINEEDPFSFGNDRKIKEGYLKGKEIQGFITDPDRKLTLSVTGDNQDGPDSDVMLSCYRKQYEDKVFEKKVSISNEKSEIWDFSPDEHIKTVELSVGENGGVKYCLEQPALAKTQTGITNGQGQSKTTQTTPKVVYTTPIKSYGSSKKINNKKSVVGLSKTETSDILKALNNGEVNTVKGYLDKGMDPNVLIYGTPLLQKAANLSSAEMVNLIIERGGDLHYKDRSGNNALARAQSNSKYYQEVVPVLVEAGITVDQNTPIWKIAFKTKGGKFSPGVRETLEYLLSKGADVDTPISKSGNTLLMFACKMAWLEPVEFYLAHGADVNAKDKDGNTALSWAKTERSGEQPYEKQHRKTIIELLESKGAQ